jgi:hypothetical protein
MRGRGGAERVRGDHGGGRPWRRKRVIAEVVRIRGRVAASVDLLVSLFLNAA